MILTAAIRCHDLENDFLKEHTFYNCTASLSLGLSLQLKRPVSPLSENAPTRPQNAKKSPLSSSSEVRQSVSVSSVWDGLRFLSICVTDSSPHLSSVSLFFPSLLLTYLHSSPSLSSFSIPSISSSFINLFLKLVVK